MGTTAGTATAERTAPASPGRSGGGFGPQADGRGHGGFDHDGDGGFGQGGGQFGQPQQGQPQPYGTPQAPGFDRSLTVTSALSRPRTIPEGG